MCGGSYRLSLWANNASPIAGSLAVGCFVDPNGGILTSGIQTESASNSPASCLTFCANKGYKYAGMEFAKQCFCGNGNTGASTSGSQCSTPCSGNSGQTCGANNRMNVYTIGPAAPASPTSTCSAANPGATGSPSLPSGWSSVGCYTDSEASRSLSGKSQSSNSNTAASCIAFCSSSGFTFAGTQYGTQCFCGNSLGGASASSSDCSVACAGDSSQKCGGGYRLSVYKQTVAAAYTAVGCFQDAEANRALTGPKTESNTMTNDICSKTCSDQGYTYSGTEYGSQCYCGNTKPTTTSTNCNVKCSGDSSQTCGGGYALTVVQSNASKWNSVGCLRDPGNPRTLVGTGMSSSSLTIESCQTFCKNAGYSIAGMEFSSESVDPSNLTCIGLFLLS